MVFVVDVNWFRIRIKIQWFIAAVSNWYAQRIWHKAGYIVRWMTCPCTCNRVKANYQAQLVPL